MINYLFIGVYFIPCGILVQYCRTDTSREWLETTRTTRTGRETMVNGRYRSWNNGDLHIIVRQHFNQDSTTRTTRTTRTGRETMVHESYNW